MLEQTFFPTVLDPTLKEYIARAIICEAYFKNGEISESEAYLYVS
jgi:hypothetical protein